MPRNRGAASATSASTAVTGEAGTAGPATRESLSADAGAMAQSLDATYVKPRTRQRIHKPPPPVDIPDINEDAAERKRVLNVLAQRRYRERKRQRRATSPSHTDSDESPPSGPGPIDQEQPSDAPPEDVPTEDAATEDVPAPLPSCDLSILTEVHWADISAGLDLDGGSAWPPVSLENFPVSALLTDATTAVPDLTFDSPPLHLATAAAGSSVSTPPSTIDPMALFDTSSMMMTTSSSTTTETDASLSFPDSYLLPMSDLALLRGFLRIADRLGVTSTIWDPDALSPFYAGRGATGTPPKAGKEALPPSWRPTSAQVLVAHHPLLDLIPWPSARERVVTIFDLPEAARPPAARGGGALALAQFAYDLEDAAEGVRIWGGDPCDAAGWEVGQVLFERWWFIFDRDIVAQSNRWRERRGAARLTLAGRGSGRGQAVGG